MSRWIVRLLALALLWIMLARMLHASSALSPIVDEQSHISRGLAVLRTGDLRLRIGHPIGLNVWQALPLALDSTVRLPLEHESWANAAWDRFGEQFLWRVNENPDGIVFRSRVMVMLLTLVLGAIVFRWAEELYGEPSGLLALTLYTLDPNILAHGMLATTDVGVTLFIVAAVFALWRAARMPDRRWFVAAGVFAGLALVSKYSALVLVPIFVALALLLIGVARASGALVSRRFISKRGAVSGLLVLVTALLVVLIVYALRVDLYLDEFGFLLANTGTHPSFLLGQRSIEGWWYYFPVTFLLKTPLSTLLLIGLAAVLSARHRSWRDELFLLVPALLYFLFGALSGFNVGYRHLFPTLLFFLVFASKSGQAWQPSRITCHASRLRGFISTLVIGLLMLWLALSSFTAHPNYIAYFNELAPTPHYDVLVDSNLDWGQGLKQLRSYLDEHGIERVRLGYFGTADPVAYGIAYDPLPRWPPPRSVDFVPANPAPGVYAISASNLQGVLLDEPSAFDWFRRRDPDAVVGGSILIYHVSADPDPPQAVGLCREPWTPVDDEKVNALFGREGLRVVRFDCVDAWWWPDEPTWYVVPPDVLDPPVKVVTYVRRRQDDTIVFRALRGPDVAPAPDHPLDTPARFEGGLTLLGFNGSGGATTGNALVVDSVWRVDAPPNPPVSVFAHLLDPDGAFVLAADGLGVPVESMRVGDVIAQRHQFDVSPDAATGEYTIEFGFYRLDTLERYPVIVAGRMAGREIRVGPFAIRR